MKMGTVKMGTGPIFVYILQDLYRNKIIFLTEFANYVVLKSNSFLYLSYITYRKLCSII